MPSSCIFFLRLPLYKGARKLISRGVGWGGGGGGVLIGRLQAIFDFYVSGCIQRSFNMNLPVREWAYLLHWMFLFMAYKL